MLRRLLPALCACVVGFLPMVPEALATATDAPQGPPMSAAERLKRADSCIRITPHTTASLPHVTSDIPSHAQTLTIVPDTNAHGLGPAAEISHAPQIPSANRIRAPNV